MAGGAALSGRGVVTLTGDEGEPCRWANMTTPISCNRHRFPLEITAQAVWLYFQFPLSLCLVEEMLLERSIVVSYKTVRRWARKLGPSYAGCLKRKTPRYMAP